MRGDEGQNLTSDPLSTPVDPEWRRDNVGRLLNQAIQRFESRVIELIDKPRFSGVRLAHVGVIRNLEFSGTRATDLAARASMTKQAMAELIEQCEALKLVIRVPDPRDGRAKIVRFTPNGLAFMENFRLALARAQSELKLILGKDRMDIFLESLRNYAEHTVGDRPEEATTN